MQSMLTEMFPLGYGKRNLLALAIDDYVDCSHKYLTGKPMDYSDDRQTDAYKYQLRLDFLNRLEKREDRSLVIQHFNPEHFTW